MLYHFWKLGSPTPQQVVGFDLLTTPAPAPGPSPHVDVQARTLALSPPQALQELQEAPTPGPPTSWRMPPSRKLTQAQKKVWKLRKTQKANKDNSFWLFLICFKYITMPCLVTRYPKCPSKQNLNYLQILPWGTLPLKLSERQIPNM